MKITTDLTGNESAAVRQARLKSVYDWYKGNGAYVAAGNLGVVRAAINEYLVNDIANFESFASWLLKFNLLNSPDTLIRSQLFTGGAKGVWFDPNDLPTLTQDAAGATPVTAVGQPVGRMLDKSGNATHATQAVTSKRPIYGVIPKGGRRNLLTYTSQFANPVWQSIQSIKTITADCPTIAEAEQSAKVVPDSGSILGSMSTTATFATADHVISFYAKADGVTKVSLITNADGTFTGAVYDLASATVTSTPAGWTTSIVSAGGGWFKCTASMPAVSGIRDIRFSNQLTGVAGDGTSGFLISAPQAKLGTVDTTYQRVGSIYDITEAGVPSLPYLASDLIDDELPATVPSLGSNATVWFAVDGASTILTGQTVAAGPIVTLRGARTYTMGAIDRPLSAGETAALTLYLNKARGAL